MHKTERTRWGLCFGVMASFIFAGVAAVSVSRPASAADPHRVEIAQAGAQTPPAPTTGGNTLAAGRAKYDRVCGRCHPGGEEDIGPRITNKNWSEARMQKQIREGSARMRPISLTKLPEADMPALMLYLRSIHSVQ